MQNFKDIFETRKQSFISAFSIWITVFLFTFLCVCVCVCVFVSLGNDIVIQINNFRLRQINSPLKIV